MRIAFCVGLTIALLGVGLAAQHPIGQYIISCHARPIIYLDKAGKFVTLFNQPIIQASRGGVHIQGYRWCQSAWTTNGIDVFDPYAKAWVANLQSADPTNFVLGAPYTPAVNYDNIGGVGLYVVDGNPPPSSLNPPSGSRNTSTVDYSVTPLHGGTAKPNVVVNGFFPNTNVPMSDFYADLFLPGNFIGVGFYTNDQKVDRYDILASPPGNLTLTRVASLPAPSEYDAAWAEDGNLYILRAGGLMVLDPRTGTVTTTGLSPSPIPSQGTWGAIAVAPWEQPGMMAVIASDATDQTYLVDLLTGTVTSVQDLNTVTGVSNFFINSARNTEESQLVSWQKADLKGNPVARVFYLTFGTQAAKKTAFLAPSLTGLASSPLQLGTLEIYLSIDVVTVMGLQGLLGYNPAVTLDSRGEGSVTLNYFGLPVGVNTWWQAVLSDLSDASNIIGVQVR